MSESTFLRNQTHSRPHRKRIDTALLQVGVIGRSILIYGLGLRSLGEGGSTTKVKLTPNGLPDKKHWCHRCKEAF